MYRQPVYTGQRNSREPSLCSSIIGKILLNKRSPNDRYRNESPEKLGPANAEKNETRENNIRLISKKIRRVTSMMPIVLQSNDAYKTGEKNCETCSMNKEKYKADLQSAKVIGILVDGVIEKEQAEEMNEEYDEDNMNNSDSRSAKSINNRKAGKMSLNFSVYCEGDALTHSLKCVLIKLQKTIGNTMVQICFVKSKQLRNDDKFKVFDVAVGDLKLLKYEYTNLTDVIVPLFKKISAANQNNTEICVPCVKEKLCEYNRRLENTLESGRNLRVVMRNDGPIEEKDPCCTREYPHIHAEVQGKPIVLKYSMPFQVKNLVKTKPTERPPSKVVKIDLPQNSPSFQYSMTNKSPTQSHKTLTKKETLSYERPTDLSSHGAYEPTNEDLQSQPISQQSSKSVSEEQSSIIPSDHVSLAKELSNEPEKQSVTSAPSKASIVTSKSSLQSKKDSRSLSKTSSLNSKKSSDPSTMPSDTNSSLKKEQTPTASKTISSTSVTQDSDANSSLKKELTPTASKTISSTSVTQDSSEHSHTSKGTTKTESLDSSKTPSKLSSKTSSKASSKTSVKTSSKTSSQLSQLGNDIGKRTSKVAFKDTEYESTETDESSSEDSRPETNDKDNKNNIYKTTRDTTAFPMTVTGTNGSNSNIFKKERKTVPAFMAAENSLDPAKKSLSRVGEHITVDKNKSIRQVTGICQHNQTIINKFLKKLGEDNLLSLCSPAECCKTSSFFVEQESGTDLPLSASLNSLPLDQSDLDYISKATGKPLSHEDIMLVSEEETQNKDYEWEEKYTDVNKDQIPSKWVRSFGESNTYIAFCSNEPTLIQGTAPTMKKANSKTITIKEEPRLSTIAEEGPLCDRDDQPSIPYIPSIPSLPLSEEEKTETVRKRQPSILKHTTMELRYFTVELIKEMHKNTNKHSFKNGMNIFKTLNSINSITKFETNNFVHEDESENIINDLAITEKEKQRCKSFPSSSSITELLHDGKNKNLQDTDDTLSQNKIDEMTMLDAIHLCNYNFDYTPNTFGMSLNKNVSSLKDGPLGNNNNGSVTCLHHHTNERLNENKVNLGEVNQMKSLLSEKEIEEEPTLKRPDTLFTFNKQFDSCTNQNSSLLSHKQELPKNNSIINLNYSHSNINNTFTLLNVTAPSYISVKSNHSYEVLNNTFTKGYSQNKYDKGVILHSQKNNPGCKAHKVSEYFSLQRKGYETDLTIETTRKRFLLKNYMSLFKNKISNSVHPDITSGEPTKFQHLHKSSSWSKLQTTMHKTNVDNKHEIYNMISTGIKQKQLKKYGDYKISHLTQPSLHLEFKSTEMCVALRKFLSYLPVYANNQVPIIIFTSNKIKCAVPRTKNKILSEKFFESISNDSKKLNRKSEASGKIENFFGFEKTYISVKKKPSLLGENSISESKLIQSNIKKGKTNMVLQENLDLFIENSRSINLPKSMFKEETIENQDSYHFSNSKPSCTSERCIKKCKVEDCSLIDQKYNSLHLFNIHSQPLTDNSGRHVRTVKEDLIPMVDSKRVSTCDFNKTPFCHTLGYKINEDSFVLECSRTDFEDPILLYNTEGMPLTSVSGTMLVDTMGKSLIRFGCTGNPISDCKGRPVLDSTGKHFPFIN